jgi:hypothetical protein
MPKTNLPADVAVARRRRPSAKAARVPALSQVKGRLIFAIDATMSRQPTWDRAATIQTEMFGVADAMGGLGVQLVFFRGFGQFEASEWTTTPSALAKRMQGMSCVAGMTQIHRVLAHAVAESRRTKVGALVYIGDAFEENADQVAKEAAQLALLGVPAFMFHEGHDANAGGLPRNRASDPRRHAHFDAGLVRKLSRSPGPWSMRPAAVPRSRITAIGRRGAASVAADGQEINGAHSHWLPCAHSHPRAVARSRSSIRDAGEDLRYSASLLELCGPVCSAAAGPRCSWEHELGPTGGVCGREDGRTIRRFSTRAWSNVEVQTPWVEMALNRHR